MSEDTYSRILALVFRVLDQNMKPADAAAQCKQMHESAQLAQIGHQLLDVLNVLDAELVLAIDFSKKRLAEVQQQQQEEDVDAAKECWSAAEQRLGRFKLLCGEITEIIPADVLRLQLDSLKQDYSDAEKQRLQKAINVVRTRTYYKQQKYNLFREESEGYAKAICELFDEEDPGKMLQKLRCLIGQFNLDPNRMLDVILECFECSLQRAPYFLTLLKLYEAPQQDISSFLAFKLSFYQDKSNTVIPMSLYKLIACLIVNGVLELATFVRYVGADRTACVNHSNRVWALQLSPTQLDACNDHKQRDEEAKKMAEKPQTVGVTTVSLDKDARDRRDDAPHPSTSTAGVNASVACMHPDMPLPDGRDPDQILAVNQKLGVLCALLELKSWPHSKWLLERLPEGYPFLYCPRLVNALANMCVDATQLLYYLYSQENQLSCADVDVEQLASEHGEVDLLSEWQRLTADVFSWVSALGFMLGRHPVAFCRITRLLVVLARFKFADSEESCPRPAQSEWPTRLDPQTEQVRALAQQMYAKVVSLCDDSLLPGLTLSGGNAFMSDQLWNLIGLFPYTVRYRLYGGLSAHVKRHAKLQYQQRQVQARSRYVMKRLSKDTTKMAGRQLGKLAHVHAATVFDHLLSQIQVFDNFIPSVVESLKFLTSMEYDVLSFCIIEHLSSPEKQKLKANDASISPWLQSLSTFVGMAFKRYNMELTGLLQYVANELKDGNSFDLLVLKEVITTMSGVETTTSLTDDQIQAQSGGDVLKQEEGRYCDASKNVKKTSSRLKEALLQEEHLVISLCILTAQQRGAIAFAPTEHKIYLKLVSSMLDQCQETLVQFGLFLSSNLRPDDYANRMPSAPLLIVQYGLPLEAAMFLARPAYKHKIQAKYELLKKRERAQKKSLDDDKKYELFAQAFDGIAQPLAADLQEALSQRMPCHKMEKSMLVAVFWLLETYDIETPVAAYDRAASRINANINALDHDKTLSEKARRKERERLTSLVGKLSDERRRQATHVKHVHRHLNALLDAMFGTATVDRVKVISDFVQLCVRPRSLFAEVDATYCAKFFFLMHSYKILTFCTVIIMDKMLVDVSGVLAGLTENEANCLGRLLALLLTKSLDWYRDQSLFDKECKDTPGFLRVGNAKISYKDAMINYALYKSVCYKWQHQIHNNVIRVICSMQYLPIRNALFLLIKILSCYPVVVEHRKQIEQRVAIMIDQEKEKREDLYVLANSYMTHLKSHKGQQIESKMFMDIKQPKKSSGKDKSSADAAASDSPSRKRAASPAAGTKHSAEPTVAPSASKLIKREDSDGAAPAAAAANGPSQLRRTIHNRSVVATNGELKADDAADVKPRSESKAAADSTTPKIRLSSTSAADAAAAAAAAKKPTPESDKIIEEMFKTARASIRRPPASPEGPAVPESKSDAKPMKDAAAKQENGTADKPKAKKSRVPIRAPSEEGEIKSSSRASDRPDKADKPTTKSASKEAKDDKPKKDKRSKEERKAKKRDKADKEKDKSRSASSGGRRSESRSRDLAR